LKSMPTQMMTISILASNKRVGKDNLIMVSSMRETRRAV
jgi:hypothetical protein